MRLDAGAAALAGLLLAGLLAGGCHRGREAAPIARRGVLDLSTVELEEHGPVGLDGEWELYWGRLLTPDDFRAPSPPSPTGFLSLPSPWNRFEVGGRRVGSVGCATLRLKLLPGPRRQRLALRLFNLHSAYALWLDGRLLARSGVVGESAAQEVAEPSMALAGLVTDGKPLELLLQLSNHRDREAGVVDSIQLGPERLLEENARRDWAVALFFIGCWFVMGAYHLVFYALRRSNVAMASFGAYCLLWAASYMTSETSGWAVRLFLPGLPHGVVDGLATGTFVASVPVAYLFLRWIYPGELSVAPLRAAGAVAAAFLALQLVASPWVYSWAMPAYYLWSSLVILYSVAMLERARRRGRDGAGIILVGMFALGTSGINDMLKDLRLLETVYLLPAGMLAFVMAQAFALARRFTHSFSAVERLSGELAGKNRALEREMEERAGLEREIVRVGEAERRRLGHALHDGLCQQLTGARLRCSALEAKLGTQGESAAELAQLSALLEESVGHAYDLSRGLWPEEDAREAAGPGLEELARRIAVSGGIALECRLEESRDAGAEQLAQLYRIAQEALTNAVKHARPRRLELSLLRRPPGSLTLTVRDDGIGRAAAARSSGGLGLRIMAHRAGMLGGTLEVADADGGGTVVTCTIPCGTAPGARGVVTGR